MATFFVRLTFHSKADLSSIFILLPEYLQNDVSWEEVSIIFYPSPPSDCLDKLSTSCLDSSTSMTCSKKTWHDLRHLRRQITELWKLWEGDGSGRCSARSCGLTAQTKVQPRLAKKSCELLWTQSVRPHLPPQFERCWRHPGTDVRLAG